MRPRGRAWHERDPGCLARDRALVAARYPGLEYHIDEASGKVDVTGTITLGSECGIRTPIGVRIAFPANYPDAEPQAYDAAGRFPHNPDRHFYPGGQCCLWLPPESRWRRTDPHALALFLDELAMFLDRQLTFEATGHKVWPGGQRSHGDKGYCEYIVDFFGGDQSLVTALAPALANVPDLGRNSRCPCGSGRKYKHCHLHDVETVRGRIAEPLRLRRLFRDHHR